MRGSRPGWAIVLGLALLAAPRAVLHDLGLVEERTLVNLALVVAPVAVWLTLILARGWAPLATGLRLGIGYAVVLVVAHQALWSQAIDGDPPRLGDRLADVPVAAQEVVFRVAAAFSSVVTGVAVGLLVGLCAHAVSALTRRRRTDPPPG